jgi:hypothetical protein
MVGVSYYYPDLTPNINRAMRTKTKKAASSTVKVEVAANNLDFDPVVVSFPRGVPYSIASSTSLGDDDDGGGDDAEPPLRFLRSKPKSSSSRGTLITGEDDHCTYTASASGRGHDGRLTKAYVCVYDKKAGTLRLVPSAERGTIFALDQCAKEYTPKINGAGGEETGTRSTQDQLQLLVDSFGSRKKQKVMNSRASNQVNIHSVVGTGGVMMDSVKNQEGISHDNRKTILEAGGKKVNLTELAHEQARKKLLPQYDVDADAPSKVYNAQLIMGPLAWERISRIVDKVLDKRETGVEPDWIGGLLGHKIQHRPQALTTLLETIDPTKKGSSYRIKVAFFLYFTCKLQNRLRRGTIEGNTLEDCITKIFVPHEVGMRLFELFMSPSDAVGGGYVASNQQQSKLHAHTFILYAIASGRDMKIQSINQLCADIKLDVKVASSVVREAGFVVKRTGKVGSDIGASLTVPLTFPPPKRMKRK